MQGSIPIWTDRTMYEHGHGLLLFIGGCKLCPHRHSGRKDKSGSCWWSEPHALSHHNSCHLPTAGSVHCGALQVRHQITSTCPKFQALTELRFSQIDMAIYIIIYISWIFFPYICRLLIFMWWWVRVSQKVGKFYQWLFTHLNLDSNAWKLKQLMDHLDCLMATKNAAMMIQIFTMKNCVLMSWTN